jgi:hypothetical protein
LFPFAQYGGLYTGSYHQADWEANSWLTTEAQNFPFQYEVTTQKSIVRVSDKDDLNSETYIVCQRPNVFNVPYDSDSYLMMELTAGNCKGDIAQLQSLVANAIDDIQQISNLKITDTQETDFLQNYLPKVDIDSLVNNIGTIQQKRSIPLLNNFVRWLTKAEEFWSLLDIQYRQNKTVFFHREPTLKSSDLLSQFHDVYTNLINKTQFKCHSIFG